MSRFIQINNFLFFWFFLFSRHLPLSELEDDDGDDSEDALKNGKQISSKKIYEM